MLVYGNRRFLKAAGDPPKVPRSLLFASGAVRQPFQQAPDLVQLPGLLGKGATDIMKLCCQSLLLCTLVFFSGGDAAPDVPLGLVHVQHLLDLQVQRPVKKGQPF